MGLSILRRRRLQKPPEQGYHSSNVLACLGKVREHLIVFNDPSVHIMGHGTCAPAISVALDLPIELRVLLLELESCFLELSVLGL